MKYNKVPPWSVTRILGLFMFGRWFYIVGSCCGPDTLPTMYFTAMGAVWCAVGIWLAGCSCTHQTGSFKVVCAATLVGAAIDYPVFSGVCAFQYKRAWQKESTKAKPALWKVLGGIILFWLVATYGSLEHMRFSVKDTDEKIKLRDGIYNMYKAFDASAFGEFWREGFQNFDFDKFGDRFDVAGERAALKTLEMEEFLESPTYTEADVKKKYKQMAKTYHPDKVPHNERAEAETRMQDINRAKETLMDLLAKRSGGKGSKAA